jgi:hypothetical protein
MGHGRTVGKQSLLYRHSLRESHTHVIVDDGLGSLHRGHALPWQHLTQADINTSLCGVPSILASSETGGNRRAPSKKSRVKNTEVLSVSGD